MSIQWPLQRQDSEKTATMDVLCTWNFTLVSLLFQWFSFRFYLNLLKLHSLCEQFYINIENLFFKFVPLISISIFVQMICICFWCSLRCLTRRTRKSEREKKEENYIKLRNKDKIYESELKLCFLKKFKKILSNINFF